MFSSHLVTFIEDDIVCLFAFIQHHLLVVDEVEERVVRLELCVEKGAGGAEPEDGRGRRGLAPLLVDLDVGLVNGTVEPHLLRLHSSRFSVTSVAAPLAIVFVTSLIM